MKLITPSLLGFALIATILTLLFRYALSYGIGNQLTPVIIVSAVSYAVFMFIAGWRFGKQDGEYLPIFDVGFRIHLTSYIVHIGISLLWLSLGFGSEYEETSWVITTAKYWGAILLVHFIYYLWARKNSIDHLSKEDLFE